MLQQAFRCGGGACGRMPGRAAACGWGAAQGLACDGGSRPSLRLRRLAEAACWLATPHRRAAHLPTRAPRLLAPTRRPAAAARRWRRWRACPAAHLPTLHTHSPPLLPPRCRSEALAPLSGLRALGLSHNLLDSWPEAVERLPRLAVL